MNIPNSSKLPVSLVCFISQLRVNFHSAIFDRCRLYRSCLLRISLCNRDNLIFIFLLERGSWTHCKTGTRGQWKWARITDTLTL